MRVFYVMGLGLLVWFAPLQAQDMGKGKVDFSGEIIEVPCGIDTQSLDQTIDYGAIALNKAHGLRKQFDIKLVDCQLASISKPGHHYQKATIVFNGRADEQDPSLLGISGQAKGLAIYLSDQNQKAIILGATHHDYELVTGDNRIRFFTELRVNDKRVGVGDFRALIQFVVSYF